MNKYLIAGVKCMINFHHKEFFDSRLKEYETSFLDEEVEFKMDSIINNDIKDEEGVIIIENNN